MRQAEVLSQEEKRAHELKQSSFDVPSLSHHRHKGTDPKPYSSACTGELSTAASRAKSLGHRSGVRAQSRLAHAAHIAGASSFQS
jgi:hypothetical protein